MVVACIRLDLAATLAACMTGHLMTSEPWKDMIPCGIIGLGTYPRCG